MTSEKTFISYCWTTPEHETWVLNFAEELVSAGVDIVLDKWELKEGHDLVGFMERMVTDETVKKVIMICDKLYAEKADGRSGGVGTETQIISQKVYENQKQEKFVALIVEKNEDGKPYLPTYYTSRKYIDLSSDADYSKNYETLLRWIYNRPLHVKPEIGKMPAFLTEDNDSKISTGINYRRVIQSIKDLKPTSYIDIDIYFKNVIEELHKFRMTSGKAPEEILENLESLLPLRNELAQTFDLIALYNPSNEIISKTTNFLEQILYLYYPIENQNSFYTSDFDNFKFIAHETFLMLVSALIKNDRFDVCRGVIKKKFYVQHPVSQGNGLHGFGVFYNHLESLEIINQNSERRLISLHSSLLKERCEKSNHKFSQLIQADLVCYLHYIKEGTERYDDFSYWYPFTLIYNNQFGRALEIFERATDKTYFEDMSKLFSTTGISFFNEIALKIQSEPALQPKFNYNTINILRLINYDKLNSL